MMIALRAIMMAFGLLWLMFIFGIGFAGHVVTQAARDASIQSQAQSQSDESSDDDSSDDRPSYYGESENERENARARIRERYNSETRFGTTQPMVDPDPAHRY